MITISKIELSKVKEDKIICELRGLSTDEKPTYFDKKTIDNGSIYIEIDTGKIYMYDLENKQWKEI